MNEPHCYLVGLVSFALNAPVSASTPNSCQEVLPSASFCEGEGNG
jgi:hypothetical protein